jgi:hypothetical protein
LVEGADFFGVSLKATHGRNHFAFEVGFASRDHATRGVSFKMLPNQFVGIAIRSVRRQVKQLEVITQSFDKFPGLSRYAPGHDQRSDRSAALLLPGDVLEIQ